MGADLIQWVSSKYWHHGLWFRIRGLRFSTCTRNIFSNSNSMSSSGGACTCKRKCQSKLRRSSSKARTGMPALKLGGLLTLRGHMCGLNVEIRGYWAQEQSQVN